MNDRADRLLQELESRKIDGLAAMDLRAALAAEKTAATRQRHRITDAGRARLRGGS